MVDWITSGRHASGERWAFSRYESRFDIRRGSERIFFDAIVLEPHIDSVVERMGRFDVLLTAVITGPLVASAATDMVTRLAQASIPSTREGSQRAGSEFIMSASRLRDGGALLRMAGTSVERMGQLLREHLAFLSPLIGDDLWRRRW